MILCLDAGNTRLKWGMWDGAGWRAQGALDYVAIDELPGLLPAAPQRLVACNVAGAGVAAQIEVLASALAVRPEWFLSRASACGVVNGYAKPAQLGADRWAALIGARALHQGLALVVMAGTATTIDVLDAGGVFRGGLILPGLELMRRSLACNTAGLPDAQGTFCALPTNTDDAIVSGAVQATLGAIERMACRPATADFLCLLSGGAAGELAPYLSLPLRQIDNLVLTGLVKFCHDSDSA